MNALMNSLSELNMNASISLSQLIIFSSKARKQLLQTFDLKDRHIAQALRLILDDWKKISKKQKAQLYECIQAMYDAAEKNEAQAQKELNQEKAQTQKKAQTKEIVQEKTEHLKLFNDDDDLNEIHRMCKREMTRQQTWKLVWSEWSNSTSSSASLFLRSSSARDLQRSYAQIASLSSASSVLTSTSISPTRSPARDARDLHRKPMQRPSVSPPRSPPPRSSARIPPRHSPARDSRRTPTRNTPVSPPRSPARTSPRSSPRYLPARDSRRTPTRNILVSPPRSPARTPPHGSPRGSPIKPCLSVKDLYVMFHRLSGEEHAPQGQRQRAFPGPTYRFSIEISVSPSISTSSPRSLKRFLQRSKMKLSFWIQ